MQLGLKQVTGSGVTWRGHGHRCGRSYPASPPEGATITEMSTRQGVVDGTTRLFLFFHILISSLYRQPQPSNHVRPTLTSFKPERGRVVEWRAPPLTASSARAHVQHHACQAVCWGGRGCAGVGQRVEGG